jgi:TRAP-type mannitol/chloroaromatic compound transport system permease large subunit
MAEDLLDTIGQLFGGIRGGLAFAVIFVGALLAATTGIVAASVIAMGLIALPIMLRYGYDRRIAAGVIAASGTLAQIIPPSLVLIVLADQLRVSVGDMYAGAILPGLMLAGLYAVFVGIIAIVKPQWVPALPPEARVFREPSGTSGIESLAVLVVIAALVGVLCAHWLGHKPLDERIVLSTAAGTSVAFAFALINRALKLGWLSAMAEKVTFVLVPPLALIFLVLGTIFLGVATPTEGGAMGAAGALLMAWARRRLSFQNLKEALDGTAKLTTFVVFILIGARVFSLTFYGVNGHVWVEELLTALPGGQTGFLIAVNVLIFFLAFFLDFFELAFIIVPLLGPVADKLGIDLVWFGVLLAVNMQTSFMHPPFGFALFYLRSVAPASAFLDRVSGKLTAPVTTAQIYWGAVPFVIMQLMMVGVLIAFPGLVLVYRDVPDKPAARPELRVPLQPLKPQDAEEEDLTAAFGGVSDRAPIAKPNARTMSAETERGEAEAASITQSLTSKPR